LADGLLYLLDWRFGLDNEIRPVQETALDLGIDRQVDQRVHKVFQLDLGPVRNFAGELMVQTSIIAAALLGVDGCIQRW
jgi:hypothetical protein